MAVDPDGCEQGHGRRPGGDLVITASNFATSAGRHRTYEIRLDEPLRADRARSVVWGPYVEMKQGNYRFECLIEPLGEAFEAPFDIVAEAGARTLHAGVLAVKADRHPEFFFRLIRGSRVSSSAFSPVRGSS